MVRSVLSHPQRVFTDPTAVTKTRVKRVAGEAYQGGSDTKAGVNEWLSTVAGEVLCDEPRPLWALLLETQSQTTIQAMNKQCGIEPSNILVPNPCPDECAALRTAGCHVYEGVTHGLLHAMSEERAAQTETPTSAPEGSTYSELTSAGFDAFSIVWLDYCGSIMTSSGRKRQTDILQLLQNGFLKKGRSLLALTFSVRGSKNMYRDEVADMTKQLVLTIAKGAGYFISVHSTVTYQTRSGPIHTVAFVGHESAEAREVYQKQRTVSAALKDIILRNDEKKHQRKLSIHVEVERRLALMAVWAKAGCVAELWGWIRDADWRKATAHCEAYSIGGRVFTEVVKMTHAGAHPPRALVLDTALLRVSRSCIARGIEPKVVLEEVMFAEPDVPYVDISNNYVAEISDPYDATWLNYVGRRAYNAKNLRRCEEWADMENILKKRLAGDTLGLAIPYVTASEPWEDGVIDWLITGVEKCCKAAGHPPLRIVFVSKWVLGTPHAVVVFAKHDYDATQLNRLVETIPEVKHYYSTLAFKRDRVKQPARHGLKFKTVANLIKKPLVDVPSDLFTVVEPGLFYVRPVFPGCAVSAVDFIEVDEAKRCGYRYVAPEDIATPHLILLTNEGTVAFRETWFENIKLWLMRCTDVPRRELMLLLENTHTDLVANLKEALKDAAAKTYPFVTFRTLFDEASHARHWELLHITFAVEKDEEEGEEEGEVEDGQ